MWRRSRSLIISISRARVVDLPEPVAPVTSTMPRFILLNSSTAGGSCSDSALGICVVITRRAMATVPRWR